MQPAVWTVDVADVTGSCGRRSGSDPLDLGRSDIRPYSLPTTLDMQQELGGYVRAASWGPPSTTIPFTTLPSFLPSTGCQAVYIIYIVISFRVRLYI